MPKVEDFLAAAQLKWLNLVNKSSHPWTHFLKEDASKVGGLRTLQRNPRIWRKNAHLSFNLSLFKAWTKWNKYFPGNNETTPSIGVWNNPLIKNRNNKTLPSGRLATLGFQTFGNFVSVEAGHGLVTPQ